MPEARQFVRDYPIHLDAAPAAVFPLLCPVREYEWIPDWSCDLVHTRCGVIEPGCIFRTRRWDVDVTWYVVEHDPSRSRVGFVQFYRDLAVGRFDIMLAAAEHGCDGVLHQELTALESGPAFDTLIAQRDAGLRQLAPLLNAYLHRPATA
jgi:hypothetical protein